MGLKVSIILKSIKIGAVTDELLRWRCGGGGVNVGECDGDAGHGDNGGDVDGDGGVILVHPM